MESQKGAVSSRKDAKKNKFKSPEILNDLRSKSIKELKLQCSRRSVRYAGLEEHEEFVQAIVNDMNDLQDFSVSGLLSPRLVTDISSDILEEELGSDIPMLLDVYAHFCGPCKLTHSVRTCLLNCFLYQPPSGKLVEPEFEAAARKLGKNCRVAKLDSQKYPEVASRFKVQGLPTTLLIHKGAVVSRREGTVTRHQLLDFADPFVPKQYW
jgi:thiol-disulfide isomerase/thioredoxin